MLCLRRTRAARSPLFPYGIYTIPEIAMVGKTEACLTAEGVPYEVGVAHYREVARGQLLGDTRGMLKMLIHEQTREILGVHAIGTGATGFDSHRATCDCIPRHSRLLPAGDFQLPHPGGVLQGCRAEREQQTAPAPARGAFPASGVRQQVQFLLPMNVRQFSGKASGALGAVRPDGGSRAVVRRQTARTPTGSNEPGRLYRQVAADLAYARPAGSLIPVYRTISTACWHRRTGCCIAQSAGSGQKGFVIFTTASPMRRDATGK